MKNNYIWKMTVEERGYTDVPITEWSDVCIEKYKFTEKYLSPMLKASRCGWRNAEYKYMRTPSGSETEFLVLWESEPNNSGSRWIPVSGESLGSMMCSMCDNIW